MMSRFSGILISLVIGAVPLVAAQDLSVTAPKLIQAGSGFSVQCNGSGNGTLYIVGPSGVLKRQVQLGSSVSFPAGSLVHAGHYAAILSSSAATQSTSFDVAPVDRPAKVSFLAEPSRLPVDLHDGIAGAVYVFDPYGNLIDVPSPVTFKLSAPVGSPQVHSVQTREGAAWTKMDTTTREGVDTFEAKVGDVDVSRSIQQVAGDPCRLTMDAHEADHSLQLKTAPVRDCSGNPVPDGTIVTFSETYDGGLSTADVPLKHGIAEVDLPAHPGGILTVASGVVLGNQIRWGK
jgi:hypothetical protein